MKKLLFFSLLMVGTFFAQDAFAQPCPGPGNHHVFLKGYIRTNGPNSPKVQSRIKVFRQCDGQQIYTAFCTPSNNGFTLKAYTNKAYCFEVWRGNQRLLTDEIRPSYIAQLWQARGNNAGTLPSGTTLNVDFSIAECGIQGCVALSDQDNCDGDADMSDSWEGIEMAGGKHWCTTQF